MEAAEILERIRSEEALPHGWVVFPIVTNKLILGMVGWVLGIILGFGPVRAHGIYRDSLQLYDWRLCRDFHFIDLVVVPVYRAGQRLVAHSRYPATAAAGYACDRDYAGRFCEAGRE